MNAWASNRKAPIYCKSSHSSHLSIIYKKSGLPREKFIIIHISASLGIGRYRSAPNCTLINPFDDVDAHQGRVPSLSIGTAQMFPKTLKSFLLPLFE